MTKARTAILISGRGSNMMALVEAAREPAYPAEVACVVSNKADAKGLVFAREWTIGGPRGSAWLRRAHRWRPLDVRDPSIMARSRATGATSRHGRI